ncbi:MAG: thioredoxin domain-containing protein, partial [Deltaproteobacteria bacterium]|nr:thioredoxin domain-containing protein [Deltaproteobacteria bacterium]
LADPASTCARARGAARFTARRLMEGYGADDVESQVIRRYRETEPVAIDLEGSEPLGPEDAEVTVVVFSDFECPHCRRASEAAVRVQRANPTGIRLFYKHFPLDSHPMSMSAARACVAAQAQGRFWEFHDGIYENQDDIGPGLYVRMATELQMDLDRFESERISQESATRVQRDKLEGQRVGVEATPTIFVNGRRFQDGVDSLEAWIEEE